MGNNCGSVFMMKPYFFASSTAVLVVGVVGIIVLVLVAVIFLKKK
jgi:hypothetical protein